MASASSTSTIPSHGGTEMKKHRGIVIYTVIALLVSVAFSAFVTSAAVGHNFNQEYCIYYNQTDCHYRYFEIVKLFTGSFLFIARWAFFPTFTWCLVMAIMRVFKKKNEYRDVTTDVNQERWGGYLAIETDRRDINGEGVRRFDDVTVFRKPLGF